MRPKYRSPSVPLLCPAARAFALAGLWLTAAAACAQMQLVPAINAVAGTGTAGYSGDSGLATSAKLNTPADVAFDSAGNWYIADYTNCRIRKVAIGTGNISTVAGNGTCGYNSDGIAATSAELNGPNSVAIDSSGNIYIADYTNNRIRKVTISTGYISTVAGTGTASYSGDGAAATSATLDTPAGVAVDSSGNIYIADRTNDRVRKVTISTGFISTVAGNGSACGTPTSGCGDGSAATSANLTSPNSVALDSSGNIYIADSGDNRIREVTISTGYISTVAGNGTPGYTGDGSAATSAEINGPNGAALDSSGNVYISDTQNRRIRVVNPGTGHISTLAGNGTQGTTGNSGPAISAELDDTKQITVDGLGNVYVADATAEEVRQVQLNTTFPTTALGGSSAVQDFFLETTAAETLTSMIAQQSQGSKQEYSIGTITGCTVNGSTSNPSGTICTLPITFTPAYPGPRNVPLTAVTGTGNVGFGLVGTGAGPLAVLIPGIISTVAGNGTAGTTGNGGAATSAELSDPGKVAVDSAGNVYIANYNNQDIQKVTASSGIISIVAGNGTSGFSGDGGAATSAEFKHPSGLGIDSAGNIYIADKNNCRIRKVTVATGVIATGAGNSTCAYLGDGGLATSAEIHNPSSNIALDSHGNWYFGDNSNYRLREVNASTGIITTVAGNGTQGYTGDGSAATSAEINNPSGVALDSSGNIYFCDFGAEVIRKVTVSTGIISTVAGNGTAGYSGDGGPAINAEINNPGSLTVDVAGNIYISDSNNRVRVVNAASGTISTLAGNGTGGYTGDGGPATSAELNSPADIAVDSAGNMYIADSSNNVIRKVNVSQSQLTYPTSTPVATMDGTDDPQTATVANIGNASVTFSVPGTGNNPSVSAYFQLDNATTCPELTTASSPGTLTAGLVCNYAVDFAPTIAGSVSGSVIVTDNSLGVTAATQTISLTATATKGTPPISWSNPAAITYGTALSSTQLNASSTLAGSFVYSPSSGTVLAAGSQTLSVTFNPTDTTDYNSGTDNVTLTVNSAAPAITFTVSNQTYGVSPFTVSASSNSAGAITYSVVSGPATISGSTVTITSAGTVVLQASQAASGNYSAGTQNASFTVAQATKTITFPQPTTPVTVNGTATLGATASGGDPVTYSITAGTASISGSTITYTNAGTVTIAANSAATANYTVAATVSDTVTVNAAASAYTAPATNVGSTSATQIATVNIATAGTLGTISVLTQGAASLDYAYVAGGTCATATVYSAGQACTVKYTFTPAAPGLRLGAVVLSTSTPTVLGTSYLAGSGTGPRGTFPPGIISTFAGNGTAGYSGDGGQAASAEVNQPRDVALDAAGNLYISDTSNNCVRKVNTSGVISTYAGTCGSSGYSGNGAAATSAKISSPGGIALDGAGNLYIADQSNNVVREVNAVTGFISTVAGNTTSGYNSDGIAATSAELNTPQFVMTDSAGNFYISDVGNARVREVTIATGMITTIVGNGTGGYNGDGIAATSAETNSPGRLAFDASGNLYIPEKSNNRVRMVSAGTGLISTVAGTGTQTFSGDGGAATSATLNQPLSAMLDAAGNLYIADYGNSRIREVNATTLVINTIAGNLTAGGYSGDAGPATSAELNTPVGTAMTPGTNIYIADYRNNRIRLVTQSTPAAMSLPSTAYGATSAASYQTVQNTGNGTLTIASISSSSGNFTLGGASATCANSSQVLASAAACVLGVEFTPTSVAALNGTITLTDNTLNVSSSTQTIAVSGTGVAAAPTITFTVSNQTYGVAPFAVSASSNSAGAITYSVVSGPATISGSTVTITGVGTVVLQASQAANGNYAAGTQNASFTVSAEAPTITFTVSNQTYGVAPFAVSATSNSAGAITYSVVSGPATISGSTVTITGVGTVVLQASQAANGNYTAGTQNASFTVSAAAPTITFTVSNQTYGVAPFAVSASSNSAGAITYSVVSGPATISGSTVTITGVGTVVLQASQAANGNYTAGTQNASFTVSVAAQTISFPNPGTQTYGVAPITLTANATSGLTVTYSVTSGSAWVEGKSLTITGAGSVTVQASQAGNANYSAATPVSVTFTVNPTPPTGVTVNSGSCCVLDALTTIPAAAYSLRLLSSKYSGNAVTVRRSSDNTTANIGFSGTILNTTTLTTFCASTNCFVTTWYDQTGNGNNATQSTAANQPQIVSSGAVITQNGLPSIHLVATSSTYFLLPSGIVASATSGGTVNGVFNPNSSAAWARFFDFGTGTSLNWFASPVGSGGDFQFRITTAGGGSEQGLYGLNSIDTSALRIMTFEDTSSTMSAYVNGAIYGGATASITPSQISGSNNYIGKSQYAADAYFNGYVSEFLVVASGLSAADRSTVEQNQSLYYSVALANASGSVSCCALDSLGGTAAAAYSLRRLSSSYAGSDVAVTRSSDSTTANIGFVSNVLDTATMMSFCASTTCKVSTWYDQSGNGVNLTLLSGYSLPSIVAGGTLQTALPGNLPAINFSGAELGNATLTNSGLNQTGSVSAVVQSPSSPYNGYAGVVGWSGVAGPFFGNIPGPAWGYYMSNKGVQDTYQSLSANQPLITTWAWNDYTEAMTISVNGAARGFTSTVSAGGSFTPMRVGGDGGTAYFGGYLQEIVVFAGYEMTSSDRDILERSQSQFYSIALSGILTTDNASADLGPVNLGSNASSSVTFNFTTDANLGSTPVRVVTKGATGLDFTDAGTGTCDTNGSSYNYMAGGNCNVTILFTPLYPGLRSGAVQLLGPSGTVVATAYLSGIGTAPQPDFPSGIVSTVAGSATAGYVGDGGAAISAQLNAPRSIALDGSGNLYIADYSNQVIREVNSGTGVITTYAGNHSAGYSGDGSAATSAKLNSPTGVAVDGAGNVYIADSLNNVIRKVDGVTGNISTWAGTGSQGYTGDNGAATSATMNSPQAIAFDAGGDAYVSDANNNVIRKVSAATGMISTIAGTGTSGFSGDSGAAISAQLSLPQGLALDSSGNLYIADNQNQRIRKVNASTGIITTLAGNSSASYTGDGGPAASASLSSPEDVELDPGGNLYIADAQNNVIRKISAQTGTISTAFGTGTAGFSGDGGSASNAAFQSPFAIVRSPSGNLYIDDSLNNRIRKIDLLDAPSLTLPGTPYGATSAAIYQTVENSGTSSLTIASIVSSSANFTLGGASATCANTSQVLISAGSCLVGVEFTPSSVGALSGAVTLNDNALNVGGSTQSLAVSGNSTQATPAVILSTSNASVPYGTQITFTAALPATATGTVTFQDSGIAIGTGTLSGGTATLTLSSLSAGSHSIAASYPGDANFTAASSTLLTQIITRATPSIVWTTPSAITYGTALSSTQLNATSATAGAFVYTPASGTVPGAGTQTLSVTLTPTDTADYNTATATVQLVVNQATPTVSVWPTASAITYGQTLASSTLSGGTASVGGSFGWTTPSTAPGAGTPSESATFTPTDTTDYTTPAAGSVTVTVNKATPSITWSTPSAITYGAALSSTQLNATSATAGALVYTPASGTVLGAGTQALSVTLTPTDTADYNSATASVQLVVNQAPLTITASSATVNYGAAVPIITPSYSGFVNSQTSAVLTTAPTCTTTYTTASAAGSSPSTSCSGAAAANYAISYVAGLVTVNQAPLTITASSATVSYGGAVPTITPSYSAFANGQTSAVLTTAPTCTTTYTTASAAGSSPSTSCSGAAAANYAISYVAGVVTVNLAPLTITASSATVSYGGAVPTITPSYSGFANSQTTSVLTTAPTCTTSYTTASAAGSSPPTSCSGAAAANYTISYVAGVVTVNQAPLTITASSATVNYGGAVPTITPSYSAFVNSQTSAVLTTAPTCTTTYTTASTAGSSPSTSCSGAAAANYAISYVAGVVTVNQATPSITWSTPSAITYGTALSSTQLNATSATSGALLYTPASGTVLVVGTQTLNVTLTPTDTTDYNSATASVQLVVNKAASVLSVTPSLNPSTFGDAVTFTLTVSGNGATPTGTVTLTDGATTLLSATALQANGIQTVTTSALSAGSHTLNLTYSGDANFH